MKSLIPLPFLVAAALLLVVHSALSATEPPKAPTTTTTSLKDLSPEKKSTLRQMVQMSGHIDKACEERDPDSCLSSSVNQSRVTTKAETSAKAANESGKADENSKLSTDERTQVVRSLSKDCKAGGAGACKRLAIISQEMNKPRTSIQLYKMACEHGDALVCRELSESLERAGKKDLAALYLARACQRGDTKACQNVKPAPAARGSSAATKN